MRVVKYVALGVALVAGLALSVSLVSGGVARAQYPPPGGNVTVTPSDPTPDVGETVTLTIAVVDEDGNPVANQACVAQVTSQPGTGASVLNPNVQTDANGNATVQVNVGDTAGAVTVTVTCGELSGSAVLSVGEAPAPPETGTGGNLAEGNGATWRLFLIAGLAVLAASGAGAAWLRVRASR